MLEQIRNESVLFLDIETVPQYMSYNNMPEHFQQLWNDKARTFRDEQTPEDSYARAGIYAEFGKIICVSAGLLSESPVRKLRIKSFAGHDEKELLSRFFDLLDKHYSHKDSVLCAHNGKEFDFPYLSRRGLIHGLTLPQILDNAAKKPWEVAHLDTMELWKFGDYKHYTSLNLLTAVFGIPSPKNDISGSDVANVYYNDKDLERIVVYCQKDVVSVAQLFLRYKGESLVDDDAIEIIS